MESRLKSRGLKSIGRILALLLLAYVFICIALYFGQRFLTFPGGLMSPEKRQNMLDTLPHLDVVPLSFQNHLDENLEGFQVSTQGAVDSVGLLYFGGNGNDIWYALPLVEIPGVRTWSLNYPGFGMSEGVPSEDNITRSIEAWFQSLKLEDKPYKKLILVGRSLGTGVATKLMKFIEVQDNLAHLELDLVLVTPYNSIWKVGAHRFPWIPVKYIMNSRFESELHIQSLNRSKVRFVFAEVDGIVPHQFTEGLIKSYSHYFPTRQIHRDTLWGHDHNSLLRSQRLKEILQDLRE